MLGLDYDGENPYEAATTNSLRKKVDPQRYPLMTEVLDDLFLSDPTASFEHGLSVILAGLRSFAAQHPRNSVAASARQSKAN